MEKFIEKYEKEDERAECVSITKTTKISLKKYKPNSELHSTSGLKIQDAKHEKKHCLIGECTSRKLKEEDLRCNLHSYSIKC